MRVLMCLKAKLRVFMRLFERLQQEREEAAAWLLHRHSSHYALRIKVSLFNESLSEHLV